ncbi:MAG: GFA family protein [Nevskia sp.]
MIVEGGCYCGAVRYRAEGEPQIKAQCHCRECQYTSGGSPNVIMGMPQAGFAYTKGTPKRYTRKDLPNPVTREFCGECGSPLVSLAPMLAGVALIKVGSLDNPAVFGKPELAVFTIDKQVFHSLPEGLPSFERMPG